MAGDAIGIRPQPAERLSGIRVDRAPVQARRAGTRHPEPAGSRAEASAQATPGEPLGYHRPAEVARADEQDAELTMPRGISRGHGRHPVEGRPGRRRHLGRYPRGHRQKGAAAVTAAGCCRANAATASFLIAFQSWLLTGSRRTTATSEATAISAIRRARPFRLAERIAGGSAECSAPADSAASVGSRWSSVSDIFAPVWTRSDRSCDRGLFAEDSAV